MRSDVESVAALLVEGGYRLALAESCTGGLLAARLTDPPGASRYLEAGVVSYSNEAKTGFLRVDPAVLAAHGAVSEQVAVAMVDGIREATGAEAGVAITGVAGPDGGTPGKPVGTVWIAAGLGSRRVVERYRFDGDRGAVREQSVEAALALLHRLLEDR